MLRKLTRDDVEFTLTPEPEHEPVRGNAMSSGDEAYDKSVEDKIIADLDNGNEWAWCCVKVTATWKTFSGDAYLGCCSYADEDDFRRGGYLEQMEDEALDELNAKILSNEEALAELREEQR